MNEPVETLETWSLHGDYRYQYNNHGFDDFNIKASPENMKILVNKINELTERINELEEKQNS